ncbi:ABC transporter ATP-binding protein [Luteococcus sanguinis]|uniref:ABC transporter ATP-binding protein n=2 Tax=Luteococcus sanguinis TaxID=174038 RepID=A0ABW1WYD1_9ACTN
MIAMTAVGHRYKQRVALRDVTADLSSGRVALLGPNGAGKSTLIRLLTTLSSVQVGTITIDGDNLSLAAGRESVRARLGYVPQAMELPRGYTCGELMAYVSWMRGVSDVAKATERCLTAVGLADRRDDRISSLSGGMYQRLCVAQALVHEPSLLVVDEPSVGLDPQQRVHLRNTLSSLDCQLVLATHLVDDVAGLAEEVLVLDDGVVAFHGSIQELCGGAEVSAAAVEEGYLRCVADHE